MSDLVERLHKWYEPESTTDLCNEAADEIERQKAEIERLRVALAPFAEIGRAIPESHPGWANDVFSGEWCGYRLTYLQFEKAAAALKSEQGEP